MKEPSGGGRFLFYAVAGLGITFYVLSSGRLDVSVYLDICNGRTRMEKRLFGLKVSEKIRVTKFTKLVEEYNLQGPAEWRLTYRNGTNLLGNAHYCGFPRDEFLGVAYQIYGEVRSVPDQRDNLTTEIVNLRNLARKSDSEELRRLINRLLDDSEDDLR